MIKDYLGIKIEREMEEAISKGQYPSILPIIETGCRETPNASFNFWKLLFRGEEKEAIEFKKAHVMVRNNCVGLYICFQNKLKNAFDYLIESTLTRIEKEFLIGKTLILATSAGNKDLVAQMLTLHPQAIEFKDGRALKTATENQDLSMVEFLCENGADKHANDEESLKIAIDQENKDLINYFLDGADYKILSTEYLSHAVAQRGKSQAFSHLLRADVYMESRRHLLLKELSHSVKAQRPKSHYKELRNVLRHYSLGGLKDLSKDAEIGMIVREEITRRNTQDISDLLSKNSHKDLTLDI
jgi:hypothetical protein